MNSYVFDCYDGWTVEQLKVRCHELLRLADKRDAIIEECARVADSHEEAEFGYNPTAVKIAAAIRALKDKA